MKLDELGTAFMVQRKRKGWSQEELAQRAGLSRAIVSLIELGAANATMTTLTAIANALDCGLTIALNPLGEK